MRRATRPAICTTASLRPRRRPDAQAVALVVRAGLVERRVEELARPVRDAGDTSCHRRPVHVAIEDVHEHAHPRQRRVRHAELGRGNRRLDQRDDAVGRADDETVARRVARAPDRGRSSSTRPSARRPTTRPPASDKNRPQGDRREDCDEPDPLGVHRFHEGREHVHGRGLRANRRTGRVRSARSRLHHVGAGAMMETGSAYIL